MVVTASQLESWRRAGLLPRHRRRGLGRGRGSVVDVVDPVVVSSAAALARHVRQGRDRRLAVLDWFAEAGMAAQPETPVVPEPPVAAVREAAVWALEQSVSHRLLKMARSAAGKGELGQDALYQAAGRLLAARPYRGAAHPGAVRAALAADEEPPQGARFEGMVYLVAAIGVGVEEVGADALAEAFASWGMFGLTEEDWAQMLQAAERGQGAPVDWELLEQYEGVLAPVQRASEEDLVRARTVLHGLRWFYGLYMMHGLFMPDTAALAALRDVIDASGLFPVLDQVIAVHPSPQQFAEGLAVCLGPPWDGLYERLMEQFAQDPDLFCLPGDQTGARGFTETWIRTLREQTKAAGRGNGQADADGEAPASALS